MNTTTTGRHVWAQNPARLVKNPAKRKATALLRAERHSWQRRPADRRPGDVRSVH